MIDGKQLRVVQRPGHTTAARHGEGTKGRGEAAHRGGDIGGKTGVGVEGRHDERKSSAWRSGVGAAPRARVYI